MDRIPQVKTCCYCFSLELGCKLIGGLVLISSFVLMFACLLALLSPEIKAVVIESSETGEEDMTEAEFDRHAISLIIICVLQVLQSALLLYSVFMKKELGLRIWVYMSMVFVVASATLPILEYVYKGCPKAVDCVSTFFETLMGIAITIYFIVCVNSFRLTLTGSSEAIATAEGT